MHESSLQCLALPVFFLELQVVTFINGLYKWQLEFLTPIITPLVTSRGPLCRKRHQNRVKAAGHPVTAGLVGPQMVL